MYICLEGYTVPQYAEANISVFPLFILVFVWLGEWQSGKERGFLLGLGGNDFSDFRTKSYVS